MSGETERDVSAWTIDSLHSHLSALGDERDRRYQQRFEDQEKAMQAALIAAKEAVNKAENAIGERLTLLNEFRAQSKDEQAKFIGRLEAEALATRNTERIQELTVRMQDVPTKSEVISAYKGLADRVDQLSDRVTRSEGKGSGLTAGWGYLVALVGLIGTITAVYFAAKG